MEKTLHCSKCKADKPEEDFYKNKSWKKRERNYWCKECEKAYGKVKFLCTCGLSVSKGNMYHKKAYKHLYLTKINEERGNVITTQ